MADKRRLQSEIDRCLKTVAERVEIFQEIFDKVHSASNANLKEKYEGDLKKEIKKLQRLRDQIKTWLAGSDVKTQRTVLADNRRLIEVQMERFKVIERETKTKAFSKEGLAAAARVNPRDQQRNDVRDWLNECVNELEQQVEQYEVEVETQANSKKKKKQHSEKEAVLVSRIERHRYHVKKLEMLMRLIDNDHESDLDKQIKEALEDDISYYISDNADSEFTENDFMYEDFDALIEEASYGDVSKARHEAELAAAAELLAKQEKEKEQETAKRDAEKRAAIKERQEQDRAEKEREKLAAAEKKKADKTTPVVADLVAPTATKGKALSPPQSKLKGINFAAVAGSPASVISTPKPLPGPTTSVPPVLGSGSWNEPLTVQKSPVTKGSTPTTAPLDQTSVPPTNQVSPSTPVVNSNDNTNNNNANTNGNAIANTNGNTNINNTTTMISAEAARSLNLQLLLMSSVNLPEPQEQQMGFKAPNPYHVPAWYPTKPPQHFSESNFFTNLEVDTLFFIFYHQQGTYHQYLAARELKKQAWRFHKKYLTWFQRFEEPKLITDEFEQGTYVYFDFEAGWCQRKKTDFTFEYRFLEDQDLP